MNLNTIKTAVTSRVGRQVLKMQKNSPHILFGVGVVGMIGTVVTASQATLKIEPILDEAQQNLDKAKELFEAGHEKYSANDYRHDVVVIHSKAAVELVKLYGPSIVLGVASIAALAGSHNILSKRNAALTAAYSVLEKGFAKYRERVVAELGEEKDREFRFGVEEREVIEETETGPQPKMVRRAGENGPFSIYARLWSHETSDMWSPRPDINVITLRSVENYLNDLLRTRGHVFLNDAYDALGLPRTKEGAIVGWLWRKGKGDQYIDFGLWGDETKTDFLDFAKGKESAVWLDFNVDGVMYRDI